MTDKQFDILIKEKLKDLSADVPDDMWNRILAQKKKDKKGIFWWETLGATALLVCMGIFFGWFGSLETKQNALSLPKQINETANNQYSTHNNHEAQLNGNNTNDINTATDLSVTKVVQAELKSGDTNSSIKYDRPNKSYREPTSKSDNTISVKTGNKQGNHKTNLDQKFEAILSSKALLNDNVEEYTESASNLTRYNSSQLLATRNKTVWQNNSADLSPEHLKSMKFSSVDCPSDRRGGPHGFYIEFFGSPDMAIKNMTYKSSSAKDSTSSRQLSYTLGMRFTKEIGQNMLFKTGLQFSQIKEQFNYRNENERHTVTVVTIRTITNSNGSSTTVRDTSIVEQVGYRVKTTYNKYSTWDVPVLLGYEFVGEGWKASLNGGAIFNLSSSQQGDFLDTSYTPVSFAKRGTSFFKAKLGVSLYGGVSVAKNVTPNTSLFAEPYLRYSLSDRTTGTSPFNARFHTAGILVGIRFKLNGGQATK